MEPWFDGTVLSVLARLCFSNAPEVFPSSFLVVFMGSLPARSLLDIMDVLDEMVFARVDCVADNDLFTADAEPGVRCSA